MKRIKLTREGEFTGNWFNPDASIMIMEENTRWNGSNYISKATGDQFYHEVLYFTKSEKFVLNHYSNWQGSVETYEWIDENEAVSWIIKNEFENLDFLEALPHNVKQSVLSNIDSAEV